MEPNDKIIKVIEVKYMFLYKVKLHLGWKLKIISLKLLFGKKILLHWSDKICPSVKVRINDSGIIQIGERVEIRENSVLNVTAGGKIVIDDRVFMNDGCYINAREFVHVGSDTMFGQGVKVYDHDHDYRSENLKVKFKQKSVEIGKNAWICSDVIILKGCVIGDHSVIAAGTVVRKDVANNVLCYTRMDTLEKTIEQEI